MQADTCRLDTSEPKLLPSLPAFVSLAVGKQFYRENLYVWTVRIRWVFFRDSWHSMVHGFFKFFHL